MKFPDKKLLLTCSLKAGFYIALFVAMQVIAVLVYSVLMVIAMLFGFPESSLLSPNKLIAITIFSDLFTLALIVLIELIRGRDPIKSLSIKRFDPRLIAPITSAALFICIFIMLAINMIPFPTSWVESYNSSSGSLASGNLLLVMILALIVAPVTEEVVFRVMAYKHMQRAVNRYLAALVVSVCFGLVHGTIIWFIYTVIVGFLINLIFIWVDSTLASMTFHLTFNVFGLFVGFVTELHIAIRIILLLISIAAAAVSFATVYRLNSSDRHNSHSDNID